MPYPTVEIVEEYDRVERARKAAEVEREAKLRGEDGATCTVTFHDELFRPRPNVGEFVMKRGGIAFEVVAISVGLSVTGDEPLVLWELREPGSIESIEVTDRTLLAEYEKAVPVVVNGDVLGFCGTLKPGSGIEVSLQSSEEAPRVLRESNPPNASELKHRHPAIGSVMTEALEVDSWLTTAFAAITHLAHIAEGGQP